MFLRRRKATDAGADGEARTTLTTVRDVVEIVAIVAAGAWAFYTFVYENQIKPAYGKPEVQVLSSLNRLGERKSLMAVQSHLEIRNIGSTDIWLYGFAVTVTGSNVIAREDGGRQFAAGATTAVLQPYSASGRQKSVSVFAALTRLADAHANSELDLRPGQSVPLERILYVPVNRFDELRMHVMLRYAAHAKPEPCRLELRDGVAYVALTTGNDDTDSFDEVTTALSLWSHR